MNDRFYSCARALVATIRSGSMSAAAVELKTTKSAISQKLSLFEAELGLTLLDRSGRAVTATKAGRRIFEVCIGPVDAALEAEADLGLLKGDAIAGRVSVSGPNSLLGEIFVPMLQDLRLCYQQIELELHAEDSRTDFAADDIDLAFRTGDPSRGRNIATALPPSQRALFASPDLVARMPPITSPGDLAARPCILRHQEAAAWSFHTAQGDLQTVRPKIGLRVNSMELAVGAAQAGVGIALMPVVLVQAEVDSGRLSAVLPNWLVEPVKLSLLCRAARLSAPPVAAVRRYILDNCRDRRQASSRSGTGS